MRRMALLVIHDMARMPRTRAALTGRTVSPGIFEVMVLIGREETMARLSDQTAQR